MPVLVGSCFMSALILCYAGQEILMFSTVVPLDPVFLHCCQSPACPDVCVFCDNIALPLHASDGKAASQTL